MIALGDPDGNTFDRQHRLIDCASVLRAIIEVTPEWQIQRSWADHYQDKKLNSPNDVDRRARWRPLFHRSEHGPGCRRKTGDPVPGCLPARRCWQTYVCSSKTSLNPMAWLFLPMQAFLRGRTTRIKAFAFTMSLPMAHWRTDAFSVTKKGEKHEGVPDGIKVDKTENLFVTGPKGIWVWDPQGHNLGTIVLPEQPANLAWGDKDTRLSISQPPPRCML